MKKYKMILAQIKINSIDFSDQKYLHSYPLECDGLIDSISSVGLTRPVTLVKKEEKYAIVSGFKRANAVKALGQVEILAQVIEGALSEQELEGIAITDNAYTRPLNSVEVSIVINKLEQWMSKEDILKEYYPLFGLNPSPKIYDNHRKLIGLEDEIKLSIVNEEITDRTGVKLLSFQGEDRQALYKLLKPLKASFSKQSEIIELIFEIAKREEVSIPVVIASPEIEKVRKDDEMGTAQKLAAIRYCLKKRRYPRLCALEEKFESTKKEIGLLNKIKFDHPVNFEGNNYSITLTFAQVDELKKQIENISALASSDSLKKLLEE